MGTAWLFPGQGAQSPQMLDGVRDVPAFASRFRTVCDVLGFDPLEPTVIDRNAVSSLLTVLTSSLLLDVLREQRAPTPVSVAGYSVGQWTALYAVGCLDFETLVRVVKQRADRMDACFASRPGAMLAVIGLAEKVLVDAVETIRASQPDLWISNINCVGQYSLAGSIDAITEAERMLAGLTPKKLVRIPVAGAWHCPMLAPAATAFRDVLRGVTLASPVAPVIDNVTGTWLPDTEDARTEQLCQHIDHPVQWATGVKAMIAAGATVLVEIGFGQTLTKFGFFIDRSVKHTAFDGRRS